MGHPCRDESPSHPGVPVCDAQGLLGGPDTRIGFEVCTHSATIADRADGQRAVGALVLLLAIGALLIAGSIGPSSALVLKIVCIDIIGCIAVIIGAVVVIGMRSRRPGRPVHPPLPQAGARHFIRCRGRMDELVPFAHLADVPFEPIIIPCTATHVRHTALRMAVAVIVALPITAIAMAVFAKLLHLMGLPARPNISLVWPVIQIIALALAVGPAALWPEYYRVLPGRLESLKYRPFGKLRTYQTHTLRGARIDVRFDEGRVVICTSAPPCTTEIDLNRVGQPHRFAQAIVWGAISSADAPALPSEHLTG